MNHQYNVKNYTEQGGEVTHISGVLEFGEGAQVKGFPLSAKDIADSTAASVAELKEDFNSLLAVLRAAGLLVVKKVTSITLNPTELNLTPEGEQMLTVTVLPEDATDSAVVWSSSNEDVATIQNAGLVTAVADGTATITATAHDGSGVHADCLVTVASGD